MTQDEIIEMAREAGLYQDINVSFHQALRNFYDLATAKEREACAEIAETNFGVIGSTIALAIRAKLKDKNCVG